MGWKHTLILGGAVLLLAACDTATAPIVNVRDGGPTANFTVDPTSPSEADQPLPAPAPTNFCSESGISINLGEMAGEGNCNPLDW